MGLEETPALIPAFCARRERPELLSRLAPLNPAASGARDVPARSGSECNRRPGEGSGTSRLSEPLRPETGRAPQEGSWAGAIQVRRSNETSSPSDGGEGFALVADRPRWVFIIIF